MAGKFDRSKFKSTVTAAELEAQDKAVDKAAGKEFENTFATYHKIEDGLNRFRLYPAHPTEDGATHSFVVPVQRWWLEVEVKERDDDGKVVMEGGVPKMKKVRKRVFDGRIHSSVGKDIVDEYIKFLTRTLRGEGNDEAAVTEKLLPIYGKYSPVPAQRVNGITGKPEWMMFADKVVGGVSTFGKLPIGKAVKIRLNDLIARESSDEPLGSESTNPFTDPDDGRLFDVTYNKDAKKAMDYYKSEIDSSFNKETKQINLAPLTDKQLDDFMEFDSLHDQYVDCYTSADFDTAMEGLKNLDEANDFGVFAHEAFLDICEELSRAYPAPKAKDEEGEASEKEGEVAEFDFDAMDRKALKAFNKENECGIIVTKKMTDEEIREMLFAWLDEAQNAVAAEEEEVEEEEDEIEEEDEGEEEAEEEEEEAPVVEPLPFEDEVKEEKPAAKKGGSAKDRIAALRNKKKKA